MKTKEKKKHVWLRVLGVGVAVVGILVGGFFLYAGNYMKADETAKKAILGNEEVLVTKEKKAYLFDGKGEDTALIFYPGAKVEETAYAPLCLKLAETGIDVFLVTMPYHFAFFDSNAADRYLDGRYSSYYIGGHSLGAAISTGYAAKHFDALKGVVTFAGYPMRDLHHDGFRYLSIYGDHDGHADMLQKHPEYRPDDYTEKVIEGGNHAQFGNYGKQKRDGLATIPSEEQQNEAVEAVKNWIFPAA